MTDMTCDRDATHRTAIAVRLAQRNNERGSRPICPITGHRCEGDLSHLCEDYGCARKGGLSPRSEENL
jgi:hypothetical protein